jgi:hypothetical protein
MGLIVTGLMRAPGPGPGGGQALLSRLLTGCGTEILDDAAPGRPGLAAIWPPGRETCISG